MPRTALPGVERFSRLGFDAPAADIRRPANTVIEQAGAAGADVELMELAHDPAHREPPRAG